MLDNEPVGEGVRLSACDDPAGDRVGILEEVNRDVSCTTDGFLTGPQMVTFECFAVGMVTITFYKESPTFE